MCGITEMWQISFLNLAQKIYLNEIEQNCFHNHIKIISLIQYTTNYKQEITSIGFHNSVTSYLR